MASASGIFRFDVPAPAISSAELQGKHELIIDGTGLSDVVEILVNGVDHSSLIASQAGMALVLKGNARELGLVPGENTIELVNSSGVRSNAFTFMR